MTDLQLVWQAADRVLKMGYPNDLTEEERLERYVADASLVAAYVLELHERVKPLDKYTAAHLYGQGLV